MAAKVHEFPGENVTITFDRARCLHAEECVRGSRRVFDPTRRRWIDPSAGDADTIVPIVHRCPTGALHYVRHDGGPAEEADRVNRVTVVPDGPLYVRGDVRVIREDGSEILVDTRIALCRCGQSERRPLCDGSHAGARFRSEATLEPGEGITAGPKEPRPLVVKVQSGGPLLLEGPVEIMAADEAVVVRQPRVALCRCGGSSRKPFCDGSHGRIGFKAE